MTKLFSLLQYKKNSYGLILCLYSVRDGLQYDSAVIKTHQNHLLIYDTSIEEDNDNTFSN